MPSLPNYVGLTSVQTPAEAVRAQDIFRDHGFLQEMSHTNMIGVLASSATIDNAIPRDTAKPYRHVQDAETLAQILNRTQEKGVSMVHFETAKEWGNGKNGEFDIITLLDELGAHDLYPAVQVNGTVTSEGLRRIYDDTGAKIVLQLRKEIMAQGMDGVLRYIRDARGSIAKILIDSSAGTGELMTEQSLRKWYPTLWDEFGDSLSYGFAGGLTGQNTTQMVRMMREVLGHSDFSIDIETGARTSQSDRTDKIDLHKVRNYAFGAKLGFLGSINHSI